MNFKKILSAVMGISMVISSAAYAAGIEYTVSDINSGTMTVSGTVPYSSNQPWVTVSILNPGYENADSTSAINCMKQTIAAVGGEGENEGEFSVKVQLKNPQGAAYKIRVNYFGSEEPLEKVMNYYTPEALSELCSNILSAKNSGNAETLKALLSNSDVFSFLGIRTSVIKEATNDEICEMLSKSDEISMTSSAESVRRAYEEAANTIILNSDKNAEYIKALRGTNKETAKDVLKGSFESGVAYDVFAETEDGTANEIIANLCDGDYETGKEFNEKFEFEVLSCGIKNADSYLEVRKIMSSYKDVFEKSWESDYDELTNSQKMKAETELISRVKDGTLETVDEIGEEFSDCIKDATKKEGSGSSGGSGGGGGGGGKITAESVKVEVPLVQEIKKENSVDTTLPFVDLEAVPWAVESISYLSGKGVISGKSKLMFEPESNVTREEFIKMAVLAFDISSEEAAECSFEDVMTNDWFYNYVALGVKFGIIKGVNELFFGSGADITRQDIAVILCRAAELKGIALSGTPKSFKDGSLISDYAKEAVDKVSAKGAAGGDENGNFNPQAFATRAEAAKMIYEVVK